MDLYKDLPLTVVTSMPMTIPNSLEHPDHDHVSTNESVKHDTTMPQQDDSDTITPDNTPIEITNNLVIQS